MNSKKPLNEFYNYKYWRETQRQQLTTSSHIFFTFSVAIIGFIINFLTNNNEKQNLVIMDLLLVSLFCFVLSIAFYIAFNLLRLGDYRKTAKLIKRGISSSEISRQTKCIGKVNWCLFYAQIIFSVLGFIGIIFSFYQIIFKL
jgi:hypothetical protein